MPLQTSLLAMNLLYVSYELRLSTSDSKPFCAFESWYFIRADDREKFPGIRQAFEVLPARSRNSGTVYRSPSSNLGQGRWKGLDSAHSMELLICHFTGQTPKSDKNVKYVMLSSKQHKGIWYACELTLNNLKIMLVFYWRKTLSYVPRR